VKNLIKQISKSKFLEKKVFFSRPLFFFFRPDGNLSVSPDWPRGSRASAFFSGKISVKTKIFGDKRCKSKVGSKSTASKLASFKACLKSIIIDLQQIFLFPVCQLLTLQFPKA
jgi:hypothetical protein